MRVEVISNRNNQSAPNHVLENFRELAKEYQLGDDDRAFLVLDRDRWDAKLFANAARECEQSNFELIVSNPCFELWVLLHFVDVSNLSSAEQDRIAEVVSP